MRTQPPRRFWGTYCGMFGLLLFFAFSACIIPPLPSLKCFTCKANCGEDTGLICKEGVCVPKDNPDPAQCKKEDGQEGVPEENTKPEESANLEENNAEENVPEREQVREEAGSPEEPNNEEQVIERPPVRVKVTAINGDGTQREITEDLSAVTNPQKAGNRFTNQWTLTGENFEDIEEKQGENIRLCPDATCSDQTKTILLKIEEKTMTSLKVSFTKMLSKTLLFLVVTISGQSVAIAQTYVLQGEGFDQDTLKFVQDLKSKVTVGTDSLELNAKTLALKGETIQMSHPTAGQKVTLDMGNSATIKVGTKSIDFDGDTITVKSANIVVEATTKATTKSPSVSMDTSVFEVIGTANKTSIKLDDANKKVVFDKTNVQLQSGTGMTDGTINGLGNLIIGYNENYPTMSTTPPPRIRTGSHNLILGKNNGYGGYGSIISGEDNIVSSHYSAALAGRFNMIDASNAAILAGGSNTDTQGNKVSRTYAAIIAGTGNTIASNADSASGICASRSKTVDNTSAFGWCCDK